LFKRFLEGILSILNYSVGGIVYQTENYNIALHAKSFILILRGTQWKYGTTK